MNPSEIARELEATGRLMGAAMAREADRALRGEPRPKRFSDWDDRPALTVHVTFRCGGCPANLEITRRQVLACRCGWEYQLETDGPEVRVEVVHVP